MTRTYIEFIELVKEVSQLQAVESLLDWDQEVMMPKDGVKDRAFLLASVSKVGHEKLTSNRLKTLIEELQKDSSLSPDASAWLPSTVQKDWNGMLSSSLASTVAGFLVHWNHPFRIVPTIWAKIYRPKRPRNCAILCLANRGFIPGTLPQTLHESNSYPSA